ncbi:Right handed beta helix region [uncultured archaeon]|nr:Right handed beta helix region [uncultured archaeon]
MNRKGFAVGIILLFVGTGIIPSTAQDNEKPSLLTSVGKWWYVGGDGPGNYTKIQNAVNASSDGDTVFVYDDSSPYIGVVLVWKSLTIQGENKNTTVIDSGGFIISVSNVTISSFTIQNSETGVYIIGYGQPTCYNMINNNIFLNVSIGVNVYSDDWPYDNTNATKYGDNFISNNVIVYTKTLGITIVNGHHNVVIGNDVSQDERYRNPDIVGLGIGVEGSFNNISYNNVHDNYMGIHLGGNGNVIYRNTITNNYNTGTHVINPSSTNVIQNNFVDNQKNVRIWMFGVPRSFVSQLTFNENYWGSARTFPYPIGGFYCYNIELIGYLLGLLFGQELAIKIINMLVEYYPNFVRFDWHPAQEPYDIPGVS